MFSGLKSKLNSAQKNLSSSLRGLTEPDKTKPSKVAVEEAPVDFYAGVDVLQSFQNDWSELHKASQKNAELSELADGLISSLQRRSEARKNKVDQLATALAHIGSILYDLDAIMEKIGELDNLFTGTQLALAALKDIREEKEFSERQLDERCRLAIYGEKRLAALEAIRSKCAAAHAEAVANQEGKRLEDRQAACEAMFRQDLAAWGGNPAAGKFEKADRETALEDVTLEDDDQKALEDFLEE